MRSRKSLRTGTRASNHWALEELLLDMDHVSACRPSAYLSVCLSQEV